MSNDIDISFVVTVYNKEYYLPAVLKALLNQTGLSNPEYIFVDDGSKDKSVEIIKKTMKNVLNVTIIVNEKNLGISKNTNKALALAKGEYVRIIDSDDILPLDSTEKMMTLAQLHEADMVYGRCIKTGVEPDKLCNETLESFNYVYCPNALNTVLTKRFVRMGQLIKTAVLKKAGGADERVFVQDETLRIRAAIYARGIIRMKANVVLIPRETDNFSGNKTQLNHDRFLAYFYAIADNPYLDSKYRKKMYMRAVSAYWKYVKECKFMPYLRKIFFVYMGNKIWTSKPKMRYLEKLKKEFLSLDKVRRY